jgi:hypothetical protein
MTLAAGAVTLLALIAPGTAHAGTGGPGGVTCTGGSSCVIQLETDVHFSGNRGFGTNNPGVTIDPPPCQWEPLGNAQVGSAAIIYNLENVQEIDGPLTAQQQQELTEATKIKAQNPQGEWYGGPVAVTAGANCGANPSYSWVAAVNGVANPPPVPLPAKTLAELAIAVMQIPAAGTKTTSPAGGTTYSNLPTFIAVTMKTVPGGIHNAGDGMPYVEVSARLDGAGATAWGYASKLKVTVPNGVGYTVTGSGGAGCGYLGSKELVSEAGVVARVGIGGHLDCGVTFREPQQTQIQAENVWTVCYVLHAEQVYGPPPGGCTVWGTMNPTIWQKNFNVQEIQAGNG